MIEVRYVLEDNVGELFTIDGKDVYRLVMFCKEPSVKFKNLETGEIVEGSVFSHNVDQFKRLVQEPNQ